MRFRNIFPLLLLLVVCAQVRAQNSTAPGVATRRVVINMKNRGPITGNFIRADADSIEVEDQGNVVTVPLEQVSSIVFDFVDVNSTNASAATVYSNTTAMNGVPATVNEPTTAPVMSTSTRRSRRDAGPSASNTLSSRSIYARTRSHSRARRSPGIESMTFSSKREAERALARLNGTASRSKKDTRAKKESTRSSKNNQSARGKRRR